jgi:hypothetical protein
MNSPNRFRRLMAHFLAAGPLTISIVGISAEILYVDLNSTNATPPYTNWSTAAGIIQDAVDAAAVGDEILVTNGTYAAGGRPVGTNLLTNRVTVDKPLTLRSVNGAEFTTIDGGQLNRCVYLANGASVFGFTLTNGYAPEGAGVWCQSTNVTVSNCVIVGNLALNSGGGARGGKLSNCTLRRNSAAGYTVPGGYNGPGADTHDYVSPGVGGGAFLCTLSDCTLAGNLAGTTGDGGGAAYCTLNSCSLIDNSALSSVHPVHGGFYEIAPGVGGGAYNCTLSNCVVRGNSAHLGGGAWQCGLTSCSLTSNQVIHVAPPDGSFCIFCGGGYGGGAVDSTLSSCVLTDNESVGVSGGILNNCTLTANSGGAANGAILNNCIIYFNSTHGGSNYDSSCTLNYCCTTPIPTNGVGNISSDPQLASFSHLSAASPCRAAGGIAYVSGVDIDGEPWSNPPSIGCDEYNAGAVTGPLNVALTTSFTNVLSGFTLQLTALIEGRTTGSYWDFGDGFTVTNQPYTSHAWPTLGDYAVVLRAFNESEPLGISATVLVHVFDGVHYVAADNAHPVAPYTSWATAARNIQDAVDTAVEPGATVLVTNGVYTDGGRVANAWSNQVVIGTLLTLKSVNGPLFTVIDGGYSNRCVSLTNGAAISGFTLAHGTARHGGGAFGGMLDNCILSGNYARGEFVFDESGVGGGAKGCTLNNCTLTGNSASYFGGGAYMCVLSNCTLTANSCQGSGGGASSSTLNNCSLAGNSAGSSGGANSCSVNNCTLTGNSAAQGGGAYDCQLTNCIVYFNTQGANYSFCTLNYCCTTPTPTNGFGNIANAPLFVDQAVGNLRLQSNSPCINAGRNAFAPPNPDLDGNPRIAGGTVDMGAFEFQNPASQISYAWLQQYSLPRDGSADFTDSDSDGMTNWQEWRCRTNPTNSSSVLSLLAPSTDGTNVSLTWKSVSGVNYFLQRSAGFKGSHVFTLLVTNLMGQSSTTTYTDTNIVGNGPFFYRVGVGD